MVILLAKCLFALLIGALVWTGIGKAGAVMELSPAFVAFARWLVAVVTVLIVIFLLWNGRGAFHV